MDDEAHSPRAENNRAGSIYKFGPFELDLPRYELRRGTKRLRLTGAPMELLALLVERRGALLNRREIAAHLWQEPGLLDVDQGINTAIRRIRDVLGDDPVKPRFIETVVGKGYRLIVEVTEISASSLAAEPTTPLAEQAAAVLIFERSEPVPVPEVAQQGPSPLAYPVPQPRRLGSRRFLLTTLVVLVFLLALAALSVAWRPHPRSLAVTGVLAQVTTNDSEQRITAAAISPDGRWLAYADITGITLKVLRNGDTQQLKAPQGFRAQQISWFPDQLKLLISGFVPEDSDPQIWTVFISGASARLFRKGSRNGVPSPAGTQILFTTNHDTELWVAGSEGEGSQPLIIERTDLGQSSFPLAFWSADGKRVSYTRRLNAVTNGDYESVEASSGKVLFARKNMRIDSACQLADGRLVYTSGGPSLAGRDSIWTVDTRPADGTILSSPRLLTSLRDGTAFAISCSEDGSKITALSERGPPHVFVGDLQHHGANLGANLGGISRLTFDTRTDYPHAWLHDNETVIFESDRSGVFQLYKQRRHDANADRLSTGAGPAVLPQLTPDGKWILYASKPKVSPSNLDRLFRIPVEGGVPVEVATGGPLEEFECPLFGGSQCVLRESAGHDALVFYALDPFTGKGRELARTPWMPHLLQDWCVSPDGSAVAFTTHGYGRSRIRILPLDGVSGHRERELEVRGSVKLGGISWAADGRGWYVAADSGTGTSLIYADLQGNSSILLDTPMSTWGVPSPDGSKLAFVDQVVDSNVWLWQSTAGPVADVSK